MMEEDYYEDPDDDTKQSTRKRGRNSKNKNKNKNNHNPLSLARGKQQSHESIWFRRTGAGYELFVQYYAGQPTGTAYHDDIGGTSNTAHEQHDKEPVAGSITVSQTTTINSRTSGGLSRASKRRKKHKQQQHQPKDASTSHEQEKTAESNQPLMIQNTNKEDTSPDHPLLRAMARANNSGTAKQNREGLQDFLRTMARPLPVTFRIRRHLNDVEKKTLQEQLQQDFSNLVQPVLGSNNKNDNNHLLYQIPNCSKADLGKRYPKLKQFLLDGSQNGSLARQELGSMLPLLALEQAKCLDDNSSSSNSSNNNNQGKKKLYRMLDMCASPGSKTLQALELLCIPSNSTKDDHASNMTTKGRILANDVSESRLNALREAIQRSGIPCVDRIVYTCQDARHLSLPTQKGWDVIVCDVPCSGDGTIRKDPHIVQLWKPSQGHVLHLTQLQILERALQLVRVGGTVCYSTCSLNPIENEAVVAAALKRFEQKHHRDNGNSHDPKEEPVMELLPVPTINGLVLRPGLKQWRVADYRDELAPTAKEQLLNNDNEEDDETPQLSWYDTFDDACRAKMPHAVRSMWPPLSESTSKKNTIWNLERCARLWPQDHDSGGFFLTLIRRNR